MPTPGAATTCQQLAKLKFLTGFDAAEGHWTVQDVLWSTWVQHGVKPREKILKEALATSRFTARLGSPDRLKTPGQNAYELDRDFVMAIYAARIAMVGGDKAANDLDGQLARERDRALDMLREEYEGRASF